MDNNAPPSETVIVSGNDEMIFMDSPIFNMYNALVQVI